MQPRDLATSLYELAKPFKALSELKEDSYQASARAREVDDLLMIPHGSLSGLLPTIETGQHLKRYDPVIRRYGFKTNAEGELPNALARVEAAAQLGFQPPNMTLPHEAGFRIVLNATATGLNAGLRDVAERIANIEHAENDSMAAAYRNMARRTLNQTRRLFTVFQKAYEAHSNALPPKLQDIGYVVADYIQEQEDQFKTLATHLDAYLGPEEAAGKHTDRAAAPRTTYSGI